MTLAVWLMALVGPMVVRGLIALGFTAVTFTGVSILMDSLVASAQANWAAMPAAVIAFATLSGIPQGLGVIFGAYSALYALRLALGFKRYIVKAT